MYIDSHCHILSSEYDDVNEIVEDAVKNGIEKMINNGYDIKSSLEVIELSKKYNNLYAAIGISPDNVDQYNEKTINFFQNLINKNKIVAIGEIGLDYYWTTETKEKQKIVFSEMLKLAEKNKLPVIVHSRNAFEDTYNILKKYNVTGIIHCFQGSVETAKLYTKLGFLLGVGGVVTFKNARKLKEVITSLPLSSFSSETDSPYLTPEPYRGSKNKPSYVIKVVEEIARLKGISTDVVIDTIDSSVKSKFDLD